jgi:hypothetical protein
VCSSCKQKFDVCPFVNEETNGSYPFAFRVKNEIWVLSEGAESRRQKGINKIKSTQSRGGIRDEKYKLRKLIKEQKKVKFNYCTY